MRRDWSPPLHNHHHAPPPRSKIPCISAAGPPPSQAQALLHPLLSLVSTAATCVLWQYLLPASAGLLYGNIFTSGALGEVLVVVVQCPGEQISSKSWIGRSSCRPIPTSRSAACGSWGVFGFEVRFYLAVVVKSDEGLVLAFPGGIAFNELGRRYTDSACMNRIALVSEVGVAVGGPDCCLRVH